jgi:hypothetical protein
VVENRYCHVFKLERVRPALVADGLAGLHIYKPYVPIVFCETRQLAEEWDLYRFLAAAHAWAETETALDRAAHTIGRSRGHDRARKRQTHQRPAAPKSRRGRALPVLPSAEWSP